ncbi:WXG100 family type VII secretion target [Mycobacterium avium]|uniref:WXG100 family type VII secretion target n=1 Tax=Mycobacterium avium TaxID=1764 RepID=UPI000406529D|nr:WXG100 family type VII secretion target [Mycobacterium avium]
MAGHLTMQLEAMASAAHILTNQADGLSSELDSIADDWRNLSSTWQGAAYLISSPHGMSGTKGQRPSQRCYRHSQLLLRLDLMLGHETIAARAFAALSPTDPES